MDGGEAEQRGHVPGEIRRPLPLPQGLPEGVPVVPGLGGEIGLDVLVVEEG